ncbi:MAG: response regulator [Candidatus Eremiobacteraeota bacterium]|nr:response regulator [Candidatus Eremiobacteraeota bacterium]
MSNGENEKNPRILIVDDNSQNLALLKIYFKSTDYELIEAETGGEAIEKARSEKPDLILLDLMLPDIDGYEVCATLKASEDTECIPIIILTALTDIKDKLKALDSGADDYLSKPVNQVELIVRVRSLLRMKNLIERIRLKEREQMELTISLERERILLEKERQVRQIFKDVLQAITQNKLHLLLDPSELSVVAQGEKKEQIELKVPHDTVKVRRALEAWLSRLGVEKSRRYNMVVCISEATTNVIKHAGLGTVTFYQLRDRVQVWIDDKGKGIDFSELPRSTLLKGHSTKVSLGMGYTIMLELMDKIYLFTNPRGTLVIMEMFLHPCEEALPPGLERMLREEGECLGEDS